MTLKEFKKLLDEDKELQKKFKKAKESVKTGKDEAAKMSKICADLGFDVPASEFALEVIGCQELDDEELEAVAGGRNYQWKIDTYGNQWPVADWGAEGCVSNYEDTDCDSFDFCDYSNTFYPVKMNCKFDYVDTDCHTADSCDLYTTYYNS